MNTELTKLNNWFCGNKLSLSDTKTVYSLFHPLNKSNIIHLVSSLFNNKQSHYKTETSIKNLGVFTDENITWFNHINYLSNKISKKYWSHVPGKKVYNLQNMKPL